MFDSSFVTLILKNSLRSPMFWIPTENFANIDFALYRDADRPPYCSFLTFDTVEGLRIMANTSQIQAAVLSTRPGHGKLTGSPPPTSIDFQLAGRDQIQTENSIPSDQVAELFNGLGSKYEILPFPCLTSDSGRVIMVNPNELAYIVARTTLLTQGQKIIDARDAGRP